MIFSEKLNFLMKLTETNNKQLALAMHVDPSLVSMFKNNKRGLPKSKTHVNSMSQFFASKCTTDYQRAALAEVLGQKQLREKFEEPLLGEILSSWLSNQENIGVDIFFRSINQTSTITTIDGNPNDKLESTGGNDLPDNVVYYDNEGRRKAVLQFFDHLLSIEGNHTLYLSSDEARDWYFEDSNYFSLLKEKIQALIKKGFTIKQIIPSARYIDEAFDLICQWLPAYGTGNVTAYYYPRLRDNVYRRTVFVVPDIAALTSVSIGEQSNIRATNLIFQRALVNIHAEEFIDYLKICKPMIKAYPSDNAIDGLMDQLVAFTTKEGPSIHVGLNISDLKMPEDMIRNLSNHHRKMTKRFINIQELFYKSLEDFPCIEVMTPMTPTDVLNAKESIPISFLGKGNEKYTLKNYRDHLVNKLYALEKYDNYHVVFTKKNPCAIPMIVKEGSAAILIKLKPFTIFEMTQPQMASACYEYLFTELEKAAPSFMNKKKYTSKLKSLIRDFDKAIEKEK